MLAVEADHDAGQAEFLGQAAGGYAYHALVPALAGQDYGPVGRAAAQQLVRLLPDAVLQLLPLPVHAAELLRQGLGLGQRSGSAAAWRPARVAEPPGGV